MSRRSTTHRRIINDKADYIAGKGFSFDETQPLLAAMVARVNGRGESLRTLPAPAGLRQDAHGQRLQGGGDGCRAQFSGALPSGCVALPHGARLAARNHAPRLERIPFGGGGDAASLSALRASGRRVAALDGALQGLRADVHTLRRAEIYRRHGGLGHSLQDRLLETSRVWTTRSSSRA